MLTRIFVLSLIRGMSEVEGVQPLRSSTTSPKTGEEFYCIAPPPL